MMVAKLAYVGQLVAGMLSLAATAVLAQVDGADVERWLTGGGLLIAAGLIVRWVLATSERVEETWTNALVAAEKRAATAEGQVTLLREQLDDEQDRNRQLRTELERCRAG